MFRRLLLASILVFAFGASASVTVVSGFLAALAALEPVTGRPGALALLALALACCLSLAVVLLTPRSPRQHGTGHTTSAPGFISRVWTQVKARPFLSSGLGGLAVLLVALNPRYLGVIVRAYLRGQTARR
jgi:cobalamin synthase